MESIAIVCDKSPFGTNAALEAIRIGAGFMALGEEINCRLILYGDGVLFLSKHLNHEILGMDPLDDGIEMADLSELPISIVKEDLEAHNLSEEDLIEYENIEIIPRAQVQERIREYDMCFKM